MYEFCMHFGLHGKTLPVNFFYTVLYCSCFIGLYCVCAAASMDPEYDTA